ncbi:MAG: hypothetical protein AAF717_12455 [Bacteroidota bacterium]
MKFYNTLFIMVAVVFGSTASAQDEIQQLTSYINGSQLVTYSESSYLSDNSASAITYIDFCPNGRYNYSYDGSYNVKGTQHTSNRNNRASGAGVAENQGDWKVVAYQGAYYLEIMDYTGQKSYYPINVQNMIAGKWKVGNVTYVFAPGKGRCL